MIHICKKQNTPTNLHILVLLPVLSNFAVYTVNTFKFFQIFRTFCQRLLRYQWLIWISTVFFINNLEEKFLDHSVYRYLKFKTPGSPVLVRGSWFIQSRIYNICVCLHCNFTNSSIVVLEKNISKQFSFIFLLKFEPQY